MELYEIQKALFQQKMVNIRNFHLSDSFENNLINLCEFRHKKNPYFNFKSRDVIMHKLCAKDFDIFY